MAKASDNIFPYIHLAPAAAPAAPAAGSQRFYLDSGDGNKLKRIDSASAVTTIEGGGAAFTGFAAYAPALTAATTNPTLGTGAVTEGRWSQTGSGSGSLINGHVYIKFGTSGTAAGSGAYRISLPANAYTSMTGRHIGSGVIYDASAGSLWTVDVSLISATTAQLLFTHATSPIASHNQPFAWSANDEIGVQFQYEVA